jgi:hypothetical protein
MTPAYSANIWDGRKGGLLRYINWAALGWGQAASFYFWGCNVWVLRGTAGYFPRCTTFEIFVDDGSSNSFMLHSEARIGNMIEVWETLEINCAAHIWPKIQRSTEMKSEKSTVLPRSRAPTGHTSQPQFLVASQAPCL